MTAVARAGGPTGTRLRVHRLVVSIALVAALTGCSEGAEVAVETSAPTATVAAPVPTAPADVAPARARIAPRAGVVRLDPGPFSDRVRVTGMRLGGGARPRLTGRLVNVADVSELIVLELRADFYDRRGRRVATGTRVYGEYGEAAAHDNPLAFAVPAARRAPSAVAAVLTIPQLVNE